MRLVGSMIAARVALAVLAIVVAFGTMGVATSRMAHADSSLIYMVDPIAAAGGVFARFGPHISATNRTDGYGIYPYDRVVLLCGVTDGDPVPPYSNTTWHFITDLSNPGEGNFWVSDHYLDTPNQPSQLTPEESQCANESSNPLYNPEDVQPNSPSAVFFEPTQGMPDVNINGLTDNSLVLKVPYSQWGAGSCSDANIVAQVPSIANTLAGWSNGRLGPVYFLKAATQEQIGQIHTIILFDPGATSDFAKITNPIKLEYERLRYGGNGQTCDWQYDPNTLLANWLGSNPANKLIVITGQDSEMKTDPNNPNSPSNYYGLWQYYFAGISKQNQTLGQQAQVCDYNNLDHAATVEDYGYIVANPPSGCPSAPDSQHALTPWNP
jgi:hypothetical protein